MQYSSYNSVPGENAEPMEEKISHILTEGNNEAYQSRYSRHRECGRRYIQSAEMNCRRIERSVRRIHRYYKILSRSPEKDRGITVAEGVSTQDPADILDNPQIDIVVELIGGIEPASEYMARAPRNGTRGYGQTIAAKGDMLQRLALKTALCFASKPASAEDPYPERAPPALLSNDFDEILGIVNGTTNYILTQMTEYGLDYEDVLKDAQEKGFAERDPSGDVRRHRCSQ